MKDTFYVVQYGKLKEIENGGFKTQFEAWSEWIAAIKRNKQDLRLEIDERETQIDEMNRDIISALEELHKLIDKIGEV